MSTNLPRIWQEHWYLFKKLENAGLKGIFMIYKNAFRAYGPNAYASAKADNDNEASA